MRLSPFLAGMSCDSTLALEQEEPLCAALGKPLVPTITALPFSIGMSGKR